MNKDNKAKEENETKEVEDMEDVNGGKSETGDRWCRKTRRN